VNPTPEPDWARITAESLWVLLAMAGGVARYLDEYLRTGILPRIGHLFAHAAVSGFSGYMVAQVCLRTVPEWSLVAAGIGGYLGTQGLEWVSTVLKRRVAGSVDSGDENADK
jgi:hypothetical protein